MYLDLNNYQKQSLSYIVKNSMQKIVTMQKVTLQHNGLPSHFTTCTASPLEIQRSISLSKRKGLGLLIRGGCVMYCQYLKYERDTLAISIPLGEMHIGFATDLRRLLNAALASDMVRFK